MLLRATSTSAGLSRGGTAASINPGNLVGRQVLETVYRQIGLAGEHRPLNLLREHTRCTDVRDRPELLRVAGRRDLDDFNRVPELPASRAATQSACQRASLLARVPIRRVRVPDDDMVKFDLASGEVCGPQLRRRRNRRPPSSVPGPPHCRSIRS